MTSCPGPRVFRRSVISAADQVAFLNTLAYDLTFTCRQLYEDLKKIVIDKRDSHFFGSIVSSVVGSGATTEYHIIDGQQRLTTVTLLLLAIRNLIRQKKVTAVEPQLDEQINERFLISKWAKEDDRIKLRPVKSDRDSLIKLFGDEEDYDQSSNLTLNYKLFCDLIQLCQYHVYRKSKKRNGESVKVSENQK